MTLVVVGPCKVKKEKSFLLFALILFSDVGTIILVKIDYEYKIERDKF